METPCLAAPRHPFLIGPCVAAQVPDLRGGLRADLGGEAEWIGLIDLVTLVARSEPVLVERPLPDAGGKPFPDAGGSGGPERMDLRLPAVEVADHRNALGIGGPNGEPRTAHSVLFSQM